MLLHRTLRKVTCTNMRKNVYVVTPRCSAAAAVVSAVVLRRPTKEYTHPYSMMHRRLPTAGIEVAPHYHQLRVFGFLGYPQFLLPCVPILARSLGVIIYFSSFLIRALVLFVFFLRFPCHFFVWLSFSF